jgi:hypothetical protein
VPLLVEIHDYNAIPNWEYRIGDLEKVNKVINIKKIISSSKMARDLLSLRLSVLTI